MIERDIKLLWQAVDHWAAVKPDAEALVFGERRLTWREFKESVDKAARAFVQAGIEPGDRVAMVAMGCPEFIISFMAASKAGAIWLGMSPKFTVDELRYQLGDCQPRMLITLRSYMGVDLVEMGMTFREEFPGIQHVLVIGEGYEGTDEFDAFVNNHAEVTGDEMDARLARVTPDADALLMYTSGSTGRPKGVLHTHQTILDNVAVQTKYFDFGEDTRALLHFPINHVAADVEIGYATVYAGGTLVFMDAFDPQASLEVIERERITVVGQVPVMFLMQFQAPKFTEMDWRHVRAFVWGGSGAPQIMLHVLGHIAEQTGARLITGYGSTELCGFVTYSMPDDDMELLMKGAGRIVPPFEMRIVDEQRQPLPHGEIGEIAIRASCVMRGYLNNPEATAAVIDDEGWYYSSDLGWVNDAGDLFITGRRSEMFKTGGENVFPREIEDVLEQHPAVLFAAVIGVPDELYSEVGHAFIMLKPGQETAEEELRAHCKSKLANFKVPKRFDIRPALPLLPNGKVNKVALKGALEAP